MELVELVYKTAIKTYFTILLVGEGAEKKKSKELKQQIRIFACIATRSYAILAFNSIKGRGV